ncbi:MAG TPA: universal stress protein [Gemmatimonadaceae bacterium]|nr:universal stress protein [Gemmatimonadaceae bacterium]
MSPTLSPAPLGGVDAEARHRAVLRNPALAGPILLATDGTSQSGAAVVAARLLAEQLDVPFEVVTVLEPDPAYGVALGGTPLYLPDVDEARRARRISEVLGYVTRFAGGAAPPPMHVRFGAIAEETADVALARSATMVVMGSAPHQRVNRVIAGERAVHVLRASPVPVLSVPPGFSALPRNILVGVDFAPASVHAAQVALLLLANGGTLTLLHMLSPLLGDAPIRDATGRDPADAVQTLLERVRTELGPYVPDGVTVETRMRTGDDADGIVQCATAMGADLVVVGTHGPRLLERVFLGSVASSVVRSAAQTVLAVPPPSSGDALELWLRITGTATSAEPRDWTVALNDFTRRNVGRGATIEVDDPEIGAQMLGRGALVGVTYDPHDRRVEIMVGDAHRARRHLMHSIPKVESIAMTTDEYTATEALELRHGRGHTLVLIKR